MSKQATMERSLISIKDCFLFHQFLNQMEIIKLIINDQRTIFFHFIGSSIKWNTFTCFYVGLSNHVTDGFPIENRNALLWQKTDRNGPHSFKSFRSQQNHGLIDRRSIKTRVNWPIRSINRVDEIQLTLIMNMTTPQIVRTSNTAVPFWTTFVGTMIFHVFITWLVGSNHPQKGSKLMML